MATQSFPAAPVNAEPFVDRGPATAFMVPRTGDVLDRLPEQAAERLRQLRQRAEDAAALARSTFGAQEEQRTAKPKHQARIKQLTQSPSAGGYGLPVDAPQVVEEQKKVDKADAEFKRLNELAEVRAAQRSTLQRIENAIEKFFARQPSGTAIAPWEGEAPTLKKGESVTDAIENRRRRLRELGADLHRVRSSPFPSAEAKARMRAQIEALAERGQPSVLGLVENKTAVEFTTVQVRSRVLNGDPALVAFSEELIDVLALVAWLHRDELLKKLDAEIAECADDGAALTDQQRRAQEVTIQSDMLAVEREECELIEMALAQGIGVSCRDDVNVLAFLGLQLVAAPEASPPDASSPWTVEHVGGR